MCYTYDMDERKMTDAEVKEYCERLAEAAASMAIEGITFTEEEEAVFAYMADARMGPEESMQYLRDYLNGKVRPPVPQPAE